jgi:H+/Cl- antiporter ClcA
MEEAMPNWLVLILRWGGLALAVVMAAALIVSRYLAPAPEAGAMPEPTAAPLTLYWILLVIGLIAAALGFYVRRPKP